jgi:hypothetical protein
MAIIHIGKKRKGRVEVQSMQDHAAEQSIRLKAGIFEGHVLKLSRDRGPKIPDASDCMSCSNSSLGKWLLFKPHSPPLGFPSEV